MSPWWGFGLWEWCFADLIFQLFWKTENGSAAWYCNLARLTISCSQTDHRHSGLPNEIVQMHPRGSRGLWVLNVILSQPKAQVGTWEMLSCASSDIFEMMIGKKGKDTSGRKSKPSNTHKISDLFDRFMYWKYSFDLSLQQMPTQVPLFFYTSSPFRRWKCMGKCNRFVDG